VDRLANGRQMRSHAPRYPRGTTRSAPPSPRGQQPAPADAIGAAAALRGGRPADAAGVRALQRAAGNRAVSQAVLQRQVRTPIAAGTSTSTKFLRIRVVGHASARWRSASTAGTADARNEQLALQRAEAVKDIIAGRLERR